MGAKVPTRKAEIIEVVPSKIKRSAFSGKAYEYGNYVKVLDDKGEIHNFINGSINSIQDAEVGMRGTVSFVRSASYGLWFWRANE